MASPMLPHMGRTKALERRYAEKLAAVLKPIVERQFDNNQTRAAAAIGISQSHLSQILRSEGAGIAVLIRVRSFIDMSIDDMLGLPSLKSAATTPPPPPPPTGLPDGTRVYELLKSAVAAIEQHHSSAPPPPPTKGTPDAYRSRRRRS